MRTDPDLKARAKEREQLFAALYKRGFPAVARYVSRMGGDFEQAKDVFQEALLVYYEKTRRPDFRTNSGEMAYIFGVCKHLWIKRHKTNKRNTPWKDGLDLPEPEALQPSAHKILRYLEAAGHKCMDLLRAFYYERQKPEEIASAFGFSGIRSATVQKFKCLEKVREKVKEKSLVYEDFFE